MKFTRKRQQNDRYTVRLKQTPAKSGRYIFHKLSARKTAVSFSGQSAFYIDLSAVLRYNKETENTKPHRSLNGKNDMIKAILWDVDGTLLDFKAAEKAAIKKLFIEFSLGKCTDEMIERYSEINKRFWQRLEKGEITKPEVLIGRFIKFFTEEGIDASVAPEFNERYQISLGDTIVYRDDSKEIIRSLKGRIKQYAVSNGTVRAQTKKLALSGLGEMMDGIFLSEQVGAEKPSPIFFERVFRDIPPFSKGEIMIVGDSLTSDILGGMNAGIVTCWYDPQKDAVPDGYKVDHVINDLHEVFSLIR